MARRDFSINIDVTALAGFADRLGTLSVEQIADGGVQALNDVVDATYDVARERMNAGINLSDDYLRRKMRVDHATRGKPEASITAFGSSEGRKQNNTVLGRFDPKVVTVAASESKSWAGRIPGVAKGSKQAGVTIEVVRGSRSSRFVPRGFLLPLKRGKEAGGNGFGVFARRKNGDIKHRYGPSVYQLFAFQAVRIEDEVGEALGQELVDQINEVLLKALA